VQSNVELVDRLIGSGRDAGKTRTTFVKLIEEKNFGKSDFVQFVNPSGTTGILVLRKRTLLTIKK
jgi:hypothetical protein